MAPNRGEVGMKANELLEECMLKSSAKLSVLYQINDVRDRYKNMVRIAPALMNLKLNNCDGMHFDDAMFFVVCFFELVLNTF